MKKGEIRGLFMAVLLAGCGWVLSGCTWVKVSEEGANVVILPADRVAHCTRLGEVNSSVKAGMLGLRRHSDKVQTELDRLAQNEAATMDANTLVRVSVEDGKGKYVAYRCPVAN